jgi:hypothetical protein
MAAFLFPVIFRRAENRREIRWQTALIATH